MVTAPPKPPSRSFRRCVLCTELIEVTFDAHMGPCPAAVGTKPHVLFTPTPYLTWPKETTK